MNNLLNGNVTDLTEERNKRKMKRSLKFYRDYLKTLQTDQLPIEIQTLFNDFENHHYGQDYFLKGQQIIQELACRSSHKKHRDFIEKMSPELEAKIKQVFGNYPTL